MSVYKGCDIRGDAVTELSSQRFRIWGRALGGMLPCESRFVVGGDVRTTTAKFRDALIDGLTASSMQVMDLGAVPTPMVYFAQRHVAAPACATVTGSHSPASVNGLKWSLGGRPPDTAQVETLRAAEATDGQSCDGSSGTVPGNRREGNVDDAYVEWLKGRTSASEAGGLGKVVLDPGNGCWAGRCRAIFRQLFPTTRFDVIHDRPDGKFPERDPDCAKPENLARLAEEVGQRRAALGIAFDGDGDRVAFVDGTGQPLTGEEATWVLMQSFGQELRGQALVYDIKMSDLIPGAARNLGAQPEVERSGHAFIRAKMIDTRARFGAELSGHYFHRELAGGDDALFTACRMIDFLAAGDGSLDRLRRNCPTTHMTPDLRLLVAAADQDRVLAGIQESFDKHPQNLVDGVRIDFECGWGLIRKSVTEEVLTCRFEGSSKVALKRIVSNFSAELGELGSELWTRFQERDDAS